MKKKLYRSTKDKMLGGVAGGLADYFDIDSTIIRVLFILVLFLGGSGIIAYIILWIIVPEQPYTIPEFNSNLNQSPEKDAEEKSGTAFPQETHRKDNRSIYGGIILISLGALFLLDNHLPHFDLTDYWPVILIAVGIGLLINAKKRNYNF